MTSEEKEQLRKEFDKFVDEHPDIIAVIDSYDSKIILEWFCQRIDEKDAANTILEGALKYQREKTQAQEELIKAADEVIVLQLEKDNNKGWLESSKFDKLIQLKIKYNDIKQKHNQNENHRDN